MSHTHTHSLSLRFLGSWVTPGLMLARSRTDTPTHARTHSGLRLVWLQIISLMQSSSSPFLTGLFPDDPNPVDKQGRQKKAPTAAGRIRVRRRPRGP